MRSGFEFTDVCRSAAMSCVCSRLAEAKFISLTFNRSKLTRRLSIATLVSASNFTVPRIGFSAPATSYATAEYATMCSLLSQLATCGW